MGEVRHPLVTVASYPDAIQAHLAKGLLESEGIPAFLLNEQHISLNWLVSNALGSVKLQVPASQSKQAREILETVNKGGFQSPGEAVLTCPVCGSKDVMEAKGSYRVAFFSLFFLHLPLPFKRNVFKCLACNHRWENRA